MRKYNNFKEVITCLNNSGILYLVLRNFDNLLKESMYMDGHGDVDMLVTDSHAVAKILDAGTYELHGDDGIHYWIEVNKKKVSLDLRFVGDGYYCKKWENEMLERRVNHDGYFIMQYQDYFYSLIYHAILQKKEFSEEYQYRLGIMSKQINVKLPDSPNVNDYIKVLERYMKEHNYTYTWPTDKHVPLNKKLIDNSLLEKNVDLQWIHWKYEMKLKYINFAMKCKHLIINREFK